MNTLLIKNKILPAITIIFLIALPNLPLNLSYFDTIIGAIIVLIVSYIEFKSEFLKSIGFYKTSNNFKTIFIKAPIIALLLFLGYYFILTPIVIYFTQQPLDYSAFNSIKNNPSLFITSLIFIWISAGFGEEIIWRGYFMKQFAKLFGESKISMIINIVLFGVLFGWMHAYQGISGQIITGIIGMTLAFIFYKNKYNLWLNVAIHGFFDTIALALFYFNFL